MKNSPIVNQDIKHTNIKLIYSYTEYRLKLANDSISALNTKLGSVIAFSGASIGFSINLPNKAFLLAPGEQYICYSCLILKMIVCTTLILAICTSVIGFIPQAGGAMTPPNLLMKENYFDSDENCRLIITKTWIEALEELELIRDNKSKLVKIAVLLLGSAACSAAFSIILASVISII